MHAHNALLLVSLQATFTSVQDKKKKNPALQCPTPLQHKTTQSLMQCLFSPNLSSLCSADIWQDWKQQGIIRNLNESTLYSMRHAISISNGSNRPIITVGRPLSSDFVAHCEGWTTKKKREERGRRVEGEEERELLQEMQKYRKSMHTLEKGGPLSHVFSHDPCVYFCMMNVHTIIWSYILHETLLICTYSSVFVHSKVYKCWCSSALTVWTSLGEMKEKYWCVRDRIA